VKHYAVAEIDITDSDWVAEYVAEVTQLVERHGGRYLARTPKAEKIEGWRRLPQIFVIIEWPSRESPDAFDASHGYKPYLERRRLGARSEFVIVAGEDVNGLARAR
jgi:uncharacterized protein (DUF1330 family)